MRVQPKPTLLILKSFIAGAITSAERTGESAEPLVEVRRAKEGDDDDIVGRGTREMSAKNGEDELSESLGKGWDIVEARLTRWVPD
jgi:hypothetical protein